MEGTDGEMGEEERQRAASSGGLGSGSRSGAALQTAMHQLQQLHQLQQHRHDF